MNRIGRLRESPRISRPVAGQEPRGSSRGEKTLGDGTPQHAECQAGCEAEQRE